MAGAAAPLGRVAEPDTFRRRARARRGPFCVVADGALPRCRSRGMARLRRRGARPLGAGVRGGSRRRRRAPTARRARGRGSHPAGHGRHVAGPRTLPARGAPRARRQRERAVRRVRRRRDDRVRPGVGRGGSRGRAAHALAHARRPARSASSRGRVRAQARAARAGARPGDRRGAMDLRSPGRPQRLLQPSQARRGRRSVRPQPLRGDGRRGERRRAERPVHGPLGPRTRTRPEGRGRARGRARGRRRVAGRGPCAVRARGSRRGPERLRASPDRRCRVRVGVARRVGRGDRGLSHRRDDRGGVRPRGLELRFRAGRGRPGDPDPFDRASPCRDPAGPAVPDQLRRVLREGLHPRPRGDRRRGRLGGVRQRRRAQLLRGVERRGLADDPRLPRTRVVRRGGRRGRARRLGPLVRPRAPDGQGHAGERGARCRAPSAGPFARLLPGSGPRPGRVRCLGGDRPLDRRVGRAGRRLPRRGLPPHQAQDRAGHRRRTRPRGPGGEPRDPALGGCERRLPARQTPTCSGGSTRSGC